MNAAIYEQIFMLRGRAHEGYNIENQNICHRHRTPLLSRRFSGHHYFHNLVKPTACRRSARESWRELCNHALADGILKSAN